MSNVDGLHFKYFLTHTATRYTSSYSFRLHGLWLSLWLSMSFCFECGLHTTHLVIWWCSCVECCFWLVHNFDPVLRSANKIHNIMKHYWCISGCTGLQIIHELIALFSHWMVDVIICVYYILNVKVFDGNAILRGFLIWQWQLGYICFLKEHLNDKLFYLFHDHHLFFNLLARITNPSLLLFITDTGNMIPTLFRKRKTNEIHQMS